MSDSPKPWTLHASALRKARRTLRQADPEGLHDTRVALRRIGATAAALRKEKVSRKSKVIVRRLSERRQLEVDRELLGRVAAAGLLSREAAAGLDAWWDALLRSGERKAERVTEGRKIRRLAKMLERLSRSPQSRVLTKLEQSWREARKALASPPDGKDDRELHRYRIAVKRRATWPRTWSRWGWPASKRKSRARRPPRQLWAGGTTSGYSESASNGLRTARRERARSPYRPRSAACFWSSKAPPLRYAKRRSGPPSNSPMSSRSWDGPPRREHQTMDDVR